MREPEALANYISWSEPHEQELDHEAMESSRDVIFIADADLRISYCNPAWDKFALENGGAKTTAGHTLGTDLMRVIPVPLHKFYSDTFAACRRRRLACEVAYECSSPRHFRLMHMSILPLKHANELAFVNSYRAEHEHGPDRPARAVAEHYFSPDGIVTQCSHCRRTKRQDVADAWDWVPAFLRLEDWKISPGLCHICHFYFYPRHAGAGY